MFLDMVKKQNSDLIKFASELHMKGVIQPNTYVIDLDMVRNNIRALKTTAENCGFKSYAMTKQLGRSAGICETIVDSGIDKFVAVDPWEGLKLGRAGFKLGNIGHLVQLPRNMVPALVNLHPDNITVYNIENVEYINEAARNRRRRQNIFLRIDDGKVLYKGQEGGIKLEQLPEVISAMKRLDYIKLAGLTAFPCVLFDSTTQQYEFTDKAKVLKEAYNLLKNDYPDLELNVPSANCCATYEMVKDFGGTIVEPGHAITGTTPIHAVSAQPERPAMVYVTEVSHINNDEVIVYGGGRYARGNAKKALAGRTYDDLINSDFNFSFPPEDSIDYYGAVTGNDAAKKLKPGDTVVASFRTQIFVTRSNVAHIKGISTGTPMLVGFYDNMGSSLL